MSGGGIGGSGYTTHTDVMQKVSDEFTAVNSALKQRFATLLQDMEATSGGYKGQAGEAFRGLMRTYNTDAEKLNQALKNIADQLSTQSKGYDKIHTATAQTWSDMQKKLVG